jgi:ABC-type transporter Mla subunit MlaD
MAIKKLTEKVQEEGLTNISDFLSDINANQDNGEIGFQFYLMEKVHEATDQVNSLVNDVTTLTSQIGDLSKELSALSAIVTPPKDPIKK